MHAHAQVMHKLSACASKLALVLGDECAASSRRLLAASDSAFFLGESTILAGRAARTRTSSARQASGLSFRRLEGDDEAPLVGQELSRCTERESAERPSRTTCNTDSLEPTTPLQRTATSSCSELLGAGAATSTEASSQDVSLSFEPTSEPLALAHLREECGLMLKLRHPHVLCCSCWASSPVGVPVRISCSAQRRVCLYGGRAG